MTTNPSSDQQFLIVGKLYAVWEWDNDEKEKGEWRIGIAIEPMAPEINTLEFKDPWDVITVDKEDHCEPVDSYTTKLPPINPPMQLEDQEDSTTSVEYSNPSSFSGTTALSAVELTKVKNAVKKQRIKAAKAEKAAQEEEVNKRKSLLHQRKTMKESANSYNVFEDSVPPKRKQPTHIEKCLVKVGEYVRVDPNPSTSDGVSGWGGLGWVTCVKGYGPASMATVKYVALSSGSGVEYDIEIGRITILKPFDVTTKSKQRTREKRKLFDPSPKEEEEHKTKHKEPKIYERLIAGKRRTKKGWLRELYNKRTPGNNRLNDEELIQLKLDAASLTAYNAANGPPSKKRKVKKNNVFVTDKDPLTKKNLWHAWGVGKNYLLNRETRAQEKKKKSSSVVGGESKKDPPNMIDNLEYAKLQLTPKRLYVHNEMVKIKADNLQSMNKRQAQDIKNEAYVRWETLNLEERSVWEMKSRNAIARQPKIGYEIVELLRGNPTMSWDQVSYELDDWCSESTIRRWFASKKCGRDDLRYAERILPLLSNAQMVKHVEFAKRLQSLWGMKKKEKKGNICGSIMMRNGSMDW